MASLLPTLLRAAAGRPPKLACDQDVWNTGVDELQRRTHGRHESGAFLLGTQQGQFRRIRQFLFYDDIDPSCFRRGIVEFDGHKFGRVWEVCAKTGMKVVADIHVHPGNYYQSGSDRNNPMIAEVGHLALILPRFATGDRMPGRIGIYEYLGARKWLDHSRRGAQVFRIGWWFK